MTNLVNRFWRIEWRHISGYHAPTLYVEAKKREDALKLGRKSSSLANFPNKWNFRLSSLPTKDELIEMGLIKVKPRKR